MGKVDVDIGNLAALLGHEAFEEQVHLDRIDGGDAQRVADRRVRRRTATLAEHAELGRRAHDIPDDQEVSGEIHLGDQAELVLELPFDLAGQRHRVAARRALVDEFAQMALRRASRRNFEEGKLSGQAFEPERAARRNRTAALDRLGILGKKPAHRGRRFEIEFGVGAQTIAGSRRLHRLAFANAGEHVGDQRVLAGCVDHRVGRDVR